MMPPEAPPVIEIPPWPKLKVFLLGLFWAIGVALVPVAMFVYDSADRYKEDPLDWTMVWHLALTTGGAGALAYWRKYVAWLRMPPPAPTPISLSLVQPAAPKTVSVTDEEGNVWKTKTPDPPKDAA